MIIEHKKVADTAINIMNAISDNQCNCREAIIALRAVQSQINAISISEIPANDYKSKIYDELVEFFGDTDLNQCTSLF